MRRFSPADLDAIQRAVLALYSHRDLRSLREAVPGIFLGVIRADYFRMGDLRVDATSGTAQVLDWWESRPLLGVERLEVDEELLFDHPLAKYLLKNDRPHRAVKLSDLLTLTQLRRTRIYREWIKPTGGGRLLAAFSVTGPGVAVLSYSRREADPDFTERDRAVLEALRPHFDKARGNLERETQLRATRAQSLKSRAMTPRETEVALWLAQGKTNREIALILDAPVRTIEKHVERVLAKMGTANRAKAAVAVNEIVRA